MAGRGNAGAVAGMAAFVVAMLLSAAAWGAQVHRAKNIILLISDGGGFNTYLATDYYEYGRVGQQVYEQEGWVHVAVRTGPLVKSGKPTGELEQDGKLLYDPGKGWDESAEKAKVGTGPFKGYNYRKDSPTDSAAAATAIATGIRTFNAAIDYGNGPEAEGTRLTRLSIAEVAKLSGRSAGVVTTVPWSHATPAALGGAHNVQRNNYAAIASEMLSSGTLDVIMGTGHPEYDHNSVPRVPRYEEDYRYVGGPENWEKLTRGTHPGKWMLVQSREEFEALMSGATPARVVGTARVAAALRQERGTTRDWDGDGFVTEDDKRISPAYGDPMLQTVPMLETMARGALNVLGKNPKGFFLMIEGGDVDHANHNNQPGRMIEEMAAFNQTVGAVVRWVESNSNWDETLVIVTSDHETGCLWGPQSDRIAFQPIVNNGAGNMPGMWFNAKAHTNSLVPLYARGPGARRFVEMTVGNDPVYGEFVENTMIGAVMKGQWPASSAKAVRTLKKRLEGLPGAPYLNRAAPVTKPTEKQKNGTEEVD